MDFGASHHVVFDFHNLSLQFYYDGLDEIAVGNGKTFPKTHTGITTLTDPSHYFPLTSVLCVPYMKCHLLSVSKIFEQNNVSIEFLPTCFFVKDLWTRKELLQGPIYGGIYEWLATSSPSFASLLPQRYSIVHTSLPDWHHHLSHPFN